MCANDGAVETILEKGDVLKAPSAVVKDFTVTKESRYLIFASFKVKQNHDHG